MAGEGCPKQRLRGLCGSFLSPPGRKASLEELQSVHSERHDSLYGTNPPAASNWTMGSWQVGAL